LNPRRLQAKVREAIACRPGAERIAAAFRSTGGAAAAADAIEQRLLRGQIASDASSAVA
jgi:UDP:flavonoid glycosyltransferase YjiC (YdhE family)